MIFMKELDDIINEQASLLKWNGYTEKQLNNGEAEGSYKEHLKLALQNLLESDKVVLFDKEPLYINLFGYFNQDKVLFTFSYEYDSLLSQLTLKKVEATLDNVPIIVAINGASDIWSSRELYQRVKQLSSTINKAITEERNIEIKNLVQKEITLLKDYGYNNSNLEKLLASSIQKIENSEAYNKCDFIVRGNLKHDIGSEMMQYKLHYRYMPSNADLRLKSILGRMGAVSKLFVITKDVPVPTADALYKYLSHERKTLAARNVMNQTVLPNLKKGK